MLAGEQVDKVLQFVALNCKVTVSQITNGKRAAGATTEAKRLTCVLLYNEIGLTQKEIAGILSLKNHTSVLNHLYNHMNYLQTSIAYGERWRIFKARFDNGFIDIYERLKTEIKELKERQTETEKRLEIILATFKREKMFNDVDLIYLDKE